jgi:predicted PurR-regulated permease PerM
MLLTGSICLVFVFITTQSISKVIYVFILLYVVQLVADNYLTPRITGKSVGINPLISFLGFVLFSTIFGLEGMILALPVLAIFKAIFDQVPGMRAWGYLMGNELTEKE